MDNNFIILAKMIAPGYQLIYVCAASIYCFWSNYCIGLYLTAHMRFYNTVMAASHDLDHSNWPLVNHVVCNE